MGKFPYGEKKSLRGKIMSNSYEKTLAESVIAQIKFFERQDEDEDRMREDDTGSTTKRRKGRDLTMKFNM